MESQQTVGYVSCEFGGERGGGHWQAAHPRWREMSAASCHVVFVARWKTQNRISLGLLARPHYPISPEVTHWGRHFNLYFNCYIFISTCLPKLTVHWTFFKKRPKRITLISFQLLRTGSLTRKKGSSCRVLGSVIPPPLDPKYREVTDPRFTPFSQ